MSERLESWEAAAPGWERQRDTIWAASRAVGEHLVDAVAPQPGETILELAAGVGDTGFAAARRLDPGGRLISSDFAPQMVESARRRAGELGVENAEFRVVDAQAIDLPDASVDGVLCRWGYMLMPEPAAALAETRRVLRAGGRLAFSVWAEPDANPWAATIGRTVVELGLVPPPGPDEPGVFALSKPERIRELVAAAGFAEPRIERVAMTWPFGSWDGWWSFTLELAAALAATIEALEPAEAERVRVAAAEKAARFAPDYEVPGVCLNVATT